MMDEEVFFKQGAESKLFIGSFNGIKCLIKERFPKKYRHADLDAQLTKERMRAESKAVSRCATFGVLTPKIYQMDLNSRKIYMEYFPDATTAKDYINQNIASSKCQEMFAILSAKIGSVVGLMHANNIIHGDLTTSNILLNPKGGNKDDYDLVMIDFGLSQYSKSTEDKGVDLYVLERALLSTHSDVPTLFSMICESYKEKHENWKEVIAKFEEVRARGRKRTMVG